MSLRTALLLAAACCLARGSTTAAAAAESAAAFDAADAADAAHVRSAREWWRFEARVRANDGREYGTVTTFFRSGAGRANDAISAVWAVTELGAGKRIEAQRAGRETLGNAHASGTRLDTSVAAWSVRAVREPAPRRKRFELRMKNGAARMSLAFSAPVRPAISDERGYFEDGGAGESHFSAYTRTAVSGALTLDGAALRVTGSGWIDHAYGDAGLSLHPAWSLYEIQLDSGRDVWNFVRRDPGGAQVSRTILVDERGEAHAQPSETVSWRRGAGPYFWRSDRTRVVYPDLYHLDSSALGISVLMTPATAAQEIVPPGGPPYWDGVMDVSDFASAKKETGIGFAQLTGF